MKQFIDLISPAQASALGWTLLHSLWQGALLGTLAAVGFYLLRRKSAESRYTVGVVMLGAQIVASMATYIYYIPSSIQKIPATLPETLASVATYTGYTAPASLPLLLRVQLWLTLHLNDLVVCWMVGVGLLLLRFVGGWAYLERLRYTSRRVKDTNWNTRFGLLVARLNVSQSVDFRESARIVTPMVIGVIQPVVLVPLGLFTGLSAAQAEAILAHELAHIRRYDYLVNLVQSLVEVLYFFHPVLWWLSNRIRAEREHCCDDLAMAVCGDPLSLAHALVRVAEFRQESSLVVAFAANKPLLLQRVKRVLGVSEKPRQRVFGYFPMALVFLSLLVGASVHAYQKEKTTEKKIRKVETLNWEPASYSLASIPAEQKFRGDTIIEAEVVAVVDATVAPVLVSVNTDLAVILGKISGEFANDTLQKKMAEYHEKMRVLQQQMKPHQEEMQALHKQTEPLQRRMADLQLDMEKQQFEVERVQREQEKVEWKKQQAMEARQQLIEKRSASMQNKLSESDLEKQMATFESQIKAKEQEITTLNEQIAQSRKKMQEVEKPMNDLSGQMEKISEEMEAYGDKIEAISDKMEVIGRKMELESNAMNEYMPAPPPPPKSPKAPGAAMGKGKIAPVPAKPAAPPTPKASGIPAIKGKIAPPPAPAKATAPPKPPRPPKEKQDN